MVVRVSWGPEATDGDHGIDDVCLYIQTNRQAVFSKIRRMLSWCFIKEKVVCEECFTSGSGRVTARKDPKYIKQANSKSAAFLYVPPNQKPKSRSREEREKKDKQSPPRPGK